MSQGREHVKGKHHLKRKYDAIESLLHIIDDAKDAVEDIIDDVKDGEIDDAIDDAKDAKDNVKFDAKEDPMIALSYAPRHLKAFYISLNSSTTRRGTTEKALNAFPGEVQRVWAISVEQVHEHETYVDKQGISENILKKPSSTERNATIGCWLSHTKLLERLATELEAENFAIILEDDVDFPEDWSKKVETTISTAPEDWDVLKVCGWGSQREEDAVNENWVLARGPFALPNYFAPKAEFFYAGSCGYVVSGRTIKRVVQHLHHQAIADFDQALLSDSAPGYPIRTYSMRQLMLHPTWGIASTIHPDSLLDTDTSRYGHQSTYGYPNMYGSVLSAVRTESLTSAGISNWPKINHQTVKGCHKIFLDLGANFGVHMREVFEPEMFPVSPMLPVFEQHFGDAILRHESTPASGVCAFGFEANPYFAPHLQKIQDQYAVKGWQARIFCPAVVSDRDGTVDFYVDQRPENSFWGSSTFSYNHDFVKQTQPGFNISAFVQNLVTARSANKATKIVMKMDIEGSEFVVLPAMLKSGVLCKGSGVDALYVEWHPWAVQNQTASFLTPDEVKTQIGQQTACDPTVVIDMDDETYIHGGPRI